MSKYTSCIHMRVSFNSSIILKLLIGFVCVFGLQREITCLNGAISLFEPKVTLKIDRFVRPFDDQTMLPVEPDVKNFFPIGQLRLFGTNLSSPYFYPAKFNIHTREGQLEGIQIESMRHLIIYKNVSSGLDAYRIRRYEFNLTQLIGPHNPFDVNRRTIILIPGYLDNSTSDWLSKAAENWLELADVNVIVVDWLTNGNFQQDSYDTIVANTRIIGRQITMLLYYMSVIRDVDFVEDFDYRKTISIVGHSIGCHIGSFVGFELRGKISRLTCLDPAGPIFDTFDWENRINLNLANFVDVLHTNAGKIDYFPDSNDNHNNNSNYSSNSHYEPNNQIANIILNRFKNKEAQFGIDNKLFNMAHVNYMANGGINQPGCSNDKPFCHHERATLIYNSILEYEIKSRISYGPESKIIKSGYYRQFAFPSPNYEIFKSGLSLLRNCPTLLSKNNFLLSDKHRYENYKRCTIPIDYIRDGIEFRQELEDDYGFNFNIRKKQQTDNSKDVELDNNFNTLNYFETLSAEPFISEHYLLRVHMQNDLNLSVNDKLNKWSNGCRLNILAKSKDNPNLFGQINFEPELLEPMNIQEEDKFYGLNLPFVNPIDWRIEQTTPFVLKEFINDSDNDVELFNRFENILTNKFLIKLDYNNEQNSESELCKLEVNLK